MASVPLRLDIPSLGPATVPPPPEPGCKNFSAATFYPVGIERVCVKRGILNACFGGAAAIGGLVEIAPLFTIDETVETAEDMRVYTPLELAGRNIYVREGCYACHSQMIRTLRDEVERYGPYSLAVESQYDRPMLWGSKRTGPDLARLGGKYSDTWHVAHLINPRDVVPESVMPRYGWLQRNALRTDDLSLHLKAMQLSSQEQHRHRAMVPVDRDFSGKRSAPAR